MQIVKPEFPIAAYEAEFRLMLGCSHSVAEPRRKLKARTGQPYFRRQCVGCGKPMSGPLRFAEIRAFEASGNVVHDWDEKLFQQYCHKKFEYGDPIRRRLNAERHRIWWQQYEEYRQTPEWKAIRQRVFQRDNNICRVCHSKPPKHAHHLNYARVGHELDSDLISVCVECHSTLHAE